jgi:hypothetical protein
LRQVAKYTIRNTSTLQWRWRFFVEVWPPALSSFSLEIEGARLFNWTVRWTTVLSRWTDALSRWTAALSRRTAVLSRWTAVLTAAGHLIVIAGRAETRDHPRVNLGEQLFAPFTETTGALAHSFHLIQVFLGLGGYNKRGGPETLYTFWHSMPCVIWVTTVIWVQMQELWQ